MVDVAKGIITNGLGGNATNLILGPQHLGYFAEIIIKPPPVEEKKRGGGGAPFEGLIPYRWPWEKRPEFDELDYHEVIFVITINKRRWVRAYHWRNKYGEALITVTNVINNIIKDIRFTVRNARSKFDKFRIKRKRDE